MEINNGKKHQLFLENNICCNQDNIIMEMLQTSISFYLAQYHHARIKKYVDIVNFVKIWNLQNLENSALDMNIRDISHNIAKDHDESS